MNVVLKFYILEQTFPKIHFFHTVCIIIHHSNTQKTINISEFQMFYLVQKSKLQTACLKIQGCISVFIFMWVVPLYPLESIHEYPTIVTRKTQVFIFFLAFDL